MSPRDDHRHPSPDAEDADLRLLPGAVREETRALWRAVRRCPVAAPAGRTCPLRGRLSDHLPRLTRPGLAAEAADAALALAREGLSHRESCPAARPLVDLAQGALATLEPTPGPMTADRA